MGVSEVQYIGGRMLGEKSGEEVEINDGKLVLKIVKLKSF